MGRCKTLNSVSTRGQECCAFYNYFRISYPCFGNRYYWYNNYNRIAGSSTKIVFNRKTIRKNMGKKVF